MKRKESMERKEWEMKRKEPNEEKGINGEKRTK